jgi:hypothetical protein
MNRSIYLLLAILVPLCMCVVPAARSQPVTGGPLDNEEWKVTREENGLKVFFRYGRESNVVECKIVANLPASQAAVLAYVSDCAVFDDWAPVFVETYKLQDLGPTEYLMHSKFRTRLREVDSDLILRFTFLPIEGGVVGLFTAVPTALPVVPALMRITHFDGRWAIRALDANTCQFTYQLTTDLGQNGIAEVIARHAFLQANTENVERLRAHFMALVRN